MNQVSDQSVAIVGGGPAGLSLARLLLERYGVSTTIFEATDRIGGKSSTFERGDFLCEMGTCYATRGDRIARRWMKQFGLRTERLGRSVFDGGDYMDYVRAASGSPLAIQVATYILARRKLLNRLHSGLHDPATLEEAATPIKQWLRARHLFKIERIHQRSLTVMGYGFLQETSTLQALRWVDLDLIISGATRDLVTPAIGWSEFWNTVARDLDVRLLEKVTAIDRTANKVQIVTDKGSETYKTVVCAIPLDEFCDIVYASEIERQINNGIRWRDYCTTLMAADWFTKEQTRGYSSPLLDPKETGRMVAARREGREPELGGDLYVTGQLIGYYSDDDLRDILKSDIEADGGKITNIILQKRWKYFPQYKSDAIQSGLLKKMSVIQGQNNTWYTGATFSHESISNITKFNSRLAANIARRISENA